MNGRCNSIETLTCRVSALAIPLASSKLPSSAFRIHRAILFLLGDLDHNRLWRESKLSSRFLCGGRKTLSEIHINCMPWCSQSYESVEEDVHVQAFGNRDWARRRADARCIFLDTIGTTTHSSHTLSHTTLSLCNQQPVHQAEDGGGRGRDRSYLQSESSMFPLGFFILGFQPFARPVHDAPRP